MFACFRPGNPTAAPPKVNRAELGCKVMYGKINQGGTKYVQHLHTLPFLDTDYTRAQSSPPPTAASETLVWQGTVLVVFPLSG